MLCSCSSFRRKPESSFGCALDSALTTSLRFSARIRASGSLFFAYTKKSNQKKCTPGAALPAAVRKVRPGFARWASLPIRELARIPARDPTGDSGLPSPRLTGPKIKSYACEAFCSGFCAQDARALALPGDPWPCGGSGRSGPVGVRARDRAHSAVAQDVQSAEPGRWRGPFGQEPERRKALGRVSLVPFFARAKKGTRSAEGRVEAFALKRQNNQKQKLDSSFRWNDERKKRRGIPAKNTRKRQTSTFDLSDISARSPPELCRYSSSNFC